MGLNARAMGPETSREGEQRIKRSDKLKVREVYWSLWPAGLTDKELRAQCPENVFERVESWRKRRSDLTREGVLRDSGVRRGGQVVWTYVNENRLPFEQGLF